MAARAALLLTLLCFVACAAQPPSMPPPLAVLFVLDKSGSMLSGFDDLKQGCVAAAATLDRSDYVGVLAFDTFPHWAGQFDHPAEKGQFVGLERLGADGGSALHRAMSEAVRAFQSLPSDPPLRKGLIVISDGNTPRADLQELVGRLVEEGIVVSALCISTDSMDAVLMSELAAWGRGRFIFTNAPARVSAFLTQETRRLKTE